MFYTYIIENPKGTFYKGSTSDYVKRLGEHNSGINKSTKNKGPWMLIFIAEFETRLEAEELEKRLKRCNKVYLRWLITQPLNILNKNLDR
jgi:putative endonuclease